MLVRSGFSLVSIMLGGVVGVIVMLAMMKMTASLTRAERGVASNLDLSELVYTIRLLTDKEDVCANSGLKGLNVTSMLTPNGTPIPVILNEGARTLKAGMDLANSSRTITSLSLISLDSLGVNREYLAKLRLVTSVKGSAVTARNPTSDFNLRVQLDTTGKIEQCGAASSAMTASTDCTGTYNIYQGADGARAVCCRLVSEYQTQDMAGVDVYCDANEYMKYGGSECFAGTGIPWPGPELTPLPGVPGNINENEGFIHNSKPYFVEDVDGNVVKQGWVTDCYREDWIADARAAAFAICCPK